MRPKCLRPEKYGHYVKLLLWRILIPWRLKRKGLQVASSARFFGMPITTMAISSSIIIGDRCVLTSDSHFTALGVNHPVVLRTLRPNAVISIGRDTGMSGASICACLRVSIGERCLIGASVIITDTDFHSIHSTDRRYGKDDQTVAARPVTIEDNVFIGANSIILKGVRIGRNSVVGAGSIVTSDVPPNAVVAGNPSRVIRVMSHVLDSGQM